MKSEYQPNALINEKSPYLLQHAFNPVSWFPWCEEAFIEAREKDKPVFVSIGYSTCHWCHVMEKESFEDDEVAALLNDYFVSIKVDREERPDIDSIYMTVCQIITGHGGWPLSIVMTPDKKPFFAGTYFPKHSKYGRIGFIDLMKRISDVWRTQRDTILSGSESITRALIEYTAGKDNAEHFSVNDLNRAYDFFAERFDETNGGFGTAPKFPSPHNLMFLLRYWKSSGEEKALEMVRKTLKSMRLGGIFDQVGKGFHRYSTDSAWILPHFEKMLYDQAMLALVYLETFQATNNKFFAGCAGETIDYVIGNMLHEQGGFYSAEDADSEGEEGKFYVWTMDELYSILPTDDADLYVKIFNISSDGNYKEEATGNRTGANIPILKKEIDEHIDELPIQADELRKKINGINDLLLKHRDKRVHPLKDDKILTDWNGLMIAALARAGRILNNDSSILQAERAVEFIYTNLTDENGNLLHRFRNNESKYDGMLDDYAFMIWGLLELYESTFNEDYLIKAVELQSKQIEYFWDNEQKGFYLTSSFSEELLVRNKEVYDGAIPSGNSVSFLNLLKIKSLTSDEKYTFYIEGLVKLFAGRMKENLYGSCMFLCGLDFMLNSKTEIIIAGNRKADNRDEMIREINKLFLPNKIVLYKNTTDENPTIGLLAPFTNNYSTIENKTTVYICENYQCNLPVTDVQMLKELLTG
ncbi:MAG: thioredoxin domain-containing protein [Melioribacteraceae bacterium]|nr:thioredoxin domain-containing protein [Melioribacteraceae bacterium]